MAARTSLNLIVEARWGTAADVSAAAKQLPAFCAPKYYRPRHHVTGQDAGRTRQVISIDLHETVTCSD